MKKTIIIMAVSTLCGVEHAYAQTVSTGDEFLTLWDFTNNSSYSVDLGVAASSFAGGLAAGYTKSITSSGDANLASFLSQINLTGGDDVEWSVEGGYSTTVNGKTYPDLVNTYLPSSVSAAAFNGNSQSVFGPTSTGITALVNFEANLQTYYGDFALNNTWNGSSVFYSTGASGNAPQALGQYEANNYYQLITTGPISAFNLPSSLEMYTVARTGSLAVNYTDQGPLNLTLTSTGLTVSNVAGVPLPAAGWMFLSGLIGLFSAKRRKNNLIISEA